MLVHRGWAVTPVIDGFIINALNLVTSLKDFGPASIVHNFEIYLQSFIINALNSVISLKDFGPASNCS